MSLANLLGSIAVGVRIAAGIQYVGGVFVDVSTLVNGVDATISLSGALSGGIASSPSSGDLCIISYCHSNAADRSNRAIYNTVGAFTQLMTAYVNDTNDTNMTLSYKFLEAPIDYNVTVGTSPGTGNAIVANIRVFRGVDTTTPFDVTYTSNPTINTGRPNPLAITPVTAGAKIAVFAAGGYIANVTNTFTSSDFDIFNTVGYPGTSRSGAFGFGLKDWTSGAFDPAQFGGPAASLADSSIAVAIALRPA